MTLSELRTKLEALAGELDDGDDPPVFLVDSYGGHRVSTYARLDRVPDSLEEAEADIRHPIIEIFVAGWEE